MLGLAARMIGAGAALLSLGGAGLLLLAAGPGQGFGPADWAALRFTLLQAALSAVLSCLLAVPLARALARRRFAGRGAVLAILSAPFILPVMAAVIGLVSIFGARGPVNLALAWLGLPGVTIFGLWGVVLAHVFLNLPLALRMLLIGWQAIPPERHRLAASLGLTPFAQFRLIELPLLAQILPGAFAAIFLICLTSFAVALTLGGGPGATTLELLIYQSLRYDFDLGHAARLALVQYGLSAALVALGLWVLPQAGADAGRGGVPQPVLAPKGWRAWADGAVILAGVVLIAAPLLSVLWRGMPGLWDLPAGLWAAAARSVLVALTSTVLALALGVVVALHLASPTLPKAQGLWIEAGAMMPLASSSLVMGTALFLASRPLPPETIALPVTILVNLALTLPYILRLLLPHARRLEADYGRLQAVLGLGTLARLRLIALPRLARPMAYAAGLSAALSMGDLGAIALFGGQGTETLPLMIARLAGAYRIEAAAAASLVLVALAFAIFWSIDRLGARDADL